MEQKDYPRQGAARDITECRFTVSAMSGNFIPMILDAIKNVDTKKVWSVTGALSTIYRGKRIHVMDCLKACFSQLNDGATHIIMEATVSKDRDADDDSFPAQDDVPLNNVREKFDALSLFQNSVSFETGFAKKRLADAFSVKSKVAVPKTEVLEQPLLGKVSFYPLGITDYMDKIACVTQMAIDRNLRVNSSHNATVLKGDINDIFDYFDAVLTYAEQTIFHYVLQITLSANSPSLSRQQVQLL